MLDETISMIFKHRDTDQDRVINRRMSGPKIISCVSFSDDGSRTSPKAPPRRRDRSARRSSPTGMLNSGNLSGEPLKQQQQQQPISNGLPPTPKVHMGACFSKVNILKSRKLDFMLDLLAFSMMLFKSESNRNCKICHNSIC